MDFSLDLLFVFK